MNYQKSLKAEIMTSETEQFNLMILKERSHDLKI